MSGRLEDRLRAHAKYESPFPSFFIADLTLAADALEAARALPEPLDFSVLIAQCRACRKRWWVWEPHNSPHAPDCPWATLRRLLGEEL